MKIIEHSLIVAADNKDLNSLLINTLTAGIFVLPSEQAEIISRWKGQADIHPDSKDELDLLNDLECQQFIVADDIQEKNMVDDLLAKYRNHHTYLSEHSPAVTFVLTYMCNFACPYCYENALSYSPQKIMTSEMVDKVFQLYNGDIVNIGLYGGEPFLPETKPIVEYIVKKAPNASFSVTTNGYYLSDFFDIMKSLRINNVMVTLDGPENLHDRTRKLRSGAGTFKRIYDGICLYLENNIPIKVRMNISENNVDECLSLREDLIQKYKQQFKDKLLRFELQPIFQLSQTIRSKLEDKIIYMTDTNGPLSYSYNTIAYSASPVLRSFVSKSKRNTGDINLKYCNCDAEGGTKFFDAEGNIYSCILSLNHLDAAVGTYFPEYKLKKDSLLTRNIETVSECRQCILKFLCGGGCANELLSSGTDVMKPNCARIKQEIYCDLPRLFRQYADRQGNI